MMAEQGYEDTPAYREWLSECAGHCHCCLCCQAVPCAGITAGGFCDDLTCEIDDDEPLKRCRYEAED